MVQMGYEDRNHVYARRKIITMDVAGEAEDMGVEEMVINTRGTPTGETKVTTHAKWTKLPPIAMKMRRTQL